MALSCRVPALTVPPRGAAAPPCAAGAGAPRSPEGPPAAIAIHQEHALPAQSSPGLCAGFGVEAPQDSVAKEPSAASPGTWLPAGRGHLARAAQVPWFGSSGLCFPNSAAQEPSPRCRLPGGPSLAPLGWHLHEICHLSATIAPMCSAYHPLLQHICALSSAHCPVSRPNPNRQLLIWPYKMSSSHRLQGKHGAPETGHSKLQPKGE